MYLGHRITGRRAVEIRKPVPPSRQAQKNTPLQRASRGVTRTRRASSGGVATGASVSSSAGIAALSQQGLHFRCHFVDLDRLQAARALELAAVRRTPCATRLSMVQRVLALAV